MSRIGNKAIHIPEGVTINQDGSTISVKGPKGALTNTFNPDIKIVIENNSIHLSRPNDEKFVRSIHGTTRALLHNMIVGVTEGYKKVLEIQGTGYRAQLQGNTVIVNAGYSHQIPMEIPEGVKVELPSPTEIHISGYDKQVVGQFTAEIRALRKPEPYKGKGIRYKGEFVRRKEGKKAK